MTNWQIWCVGPWVALIMYKALKERPMQKQKQAGDSPKVQPQSEWQPWATAPRDNRKILAAWATGLILVCRWDGKSVKSVTSYDLPTGRPVYWMPLPDAPPAPPCLPTAEEAVQWLESHRPQFRLIDEGNLWRVYNACTTAGYVILPAASIREAVYNAMAALKRNEGGPHA